jgi:hypothetical protein
MVESYPHGTTPTVMKSKTDISKLTYLFTTIQIIRNYEYSRTIVLKHLILMINIHVYSGKKKLKV